MKKKVIVISLGGSIIIPQDKKDTFLLKFKKTLERHYSSYRFVIVCGGGSIAREYQWVLENEHKPQRELSRAGIRATKMNAQFVIQVFGKEANARLPNNMLQVKSELKKNNVVISGSPCGPPRYEAHETSDNTAAKLAHYLSAEFINVTNVAGLFTADPRKYKHAKLIPYENWSQFEKIATKIHFHAGQHFVLDQKAAKCIHKNKIKTYIIGKDVKVLDNLLKGRKFKGTTIGP
jgi:uridylate kinase